ncbi:hypothetical protein [Desulfurobacterium indicum]|uniref:Uncharacterized protein n=1 Tax=Desulfurobacterium indicum TaxID=1914305 RepID=A0A1R1MJF3_9BACT|nr:hypothetical protein [Desulfurobacterium indicum]OMH39952.1 hypothetical protein BLW93_07740 [Desulfurobacterium indicum]
MKKQTALVLGMVASLAIAGCGNKSKPEEQSQNQQNAPMTAKKLPPGHPPIGNKTALPPGHPDISGMNGMGMPPHGMGMNGGMMPGMHPETMTKLAKPVKLPEEVKKTWKVADVIVIDKATGKVIKEAKVKAGDVIKIGNTEVKILYIVPDLKLMNNAYTSASNEPNNPAIIVKATENGKVTFEGPLYQKFPQIFTINNPKYDVRLKGVSKG